MTRLIFPALILLISLPARAQVPVAGFTTQAATTIAVTGTFINPPQLTANTGRQSCFIQYEGAGTGWVFFGAAAPVSTATSFQLANKSTIACGSGDGPVDANAVWLTGSAGDVFVFRVK